MVSRMTATEREPLADRDAGAARMAIAPRDPVRFLQDCGRAPRILHLADIARDAAP
jgi:hypothetical protein